MKATQREFPGLAARAARETRLFFLCGPDEAGIADAADRLASLLPDAGERVELAGADLRKDPVRLGDEARSSSLFGGARHIWVRTQGDEIHDAVKTLLDGPVEPCPVLILASGATDKSRTAKLLVDRSDALVAMFYPPDLTAATAAVRAMADAAGLVLGADLAERIATASGLDSRIARSEITKLALYRDASPQAPQRVSAEDRDAIGAATEDDDFGLIVDTVLGGRQSRIAVEIKRMREQGINPVGLLLAFERRCAQLAALAARLGDRGDVGAFLRAEAGARRIFWKDQAALTEQLAIWRGARLERLVARLIALHQNLLKNSQDGELLLSQGLVEIARFARPDVRRRRNRTA